MHLKSSLDLHQSIKMLMNLCLQIPVICLTVRFGDLPHLDESPSQNYELIRQLVNQAFNLQTVMLELRDMLFQKFDNDHYLFFFQPLSDHKNRGLQFTDSPFQAFVNQSG
jgi:hypothetical protein